MSLSENQLKLEVLHIHVFSNTSSIYLRKTGPINNFANETKLRLVNAQLAANEFQHLELRQLLVFGQYFMWDYT